MSIGSHISLETNGPVYIVLEKRGRTIHVMNLHTQEMRFVEFKTDL